MKISIYADDTINLRLDEIIQNMNNKTEIIRLRRGTAKFSLDGDFVSFPATYKQLSADISLEIIEDELAFLFTEKRYDNNFFWQSDEKRNIVSLFGWDYLTTLSRNNGIVYFICAVLVQHLEIGENHDENSGCINDLLWDKTSIDEGMRIVGFCRKCQTEYFKRATDNQKKIVNEIEKIIGDLRAASRLNMDICDFWRFSENNELFNTFLCYNNDDRNDIRELNTQLKNRGIKPWFDEEQLIPGRPWQDQLESQVSQVETASIFVGRSGIGPWQDVELKAFLQEFIRRQCPIIPVILSSCNVVPQLPVFLRQFQWIDFRAQLPDPMNQLIRGITGRMPE